jgi:hypothetical protein
MIQKGVLTLEKLFELQSKFKSVVNAKMNRYTMMHRLINLGTHKSPKFINLGTCYIE